MTDAFKGDEITMTFRHSRSGALSTDWTKTLIQDQTVRTDVAIDITELTPYHYQAKFINDGPEKSRWTLTLVDAQDTDFEYMETWFIRSKMIENSIKQIRSRQDSEGGFFKSSYGSETEDKK